MSEYLNITSLHCQIGDFHLKNLDLRVAKGAYHILLGPTGSGKSTLLNCILGLSSNVSGSIFLKNREITNVEPEGRGMGYVPQSYALFPHLNVEENICFGVSSRERGAVHDVVETLVRTLGIGPLLHRRVHGLSGGERQKVALARALAPQPDLLILDEPFSAIDEQARRFLWTELKQIIADLGVTTLHVTHSLDEAYVMGEHISILMEGQLVQTGLKHEVFQTPNNAAVARFLNYSNIFQGKAQPCDAGGLIDIGFFSIRTQQSFPVETTVGLCIRPQDIKIIRPGESLAPALQDNIFSATICSLYLLPEHCVMRVSVKESKQKYDYEIRCPAYMRERHQLAVGNDIQVAIWQPNIIVLRRQMNVNGKKYFPLRHCVTAR